MDIEKENLKDYNAAAQVLPVAPVIDDDEHEVFRKTAGGVDYRTVGWCVDGYLSNLPAMT
jgi:hypothetical protein